MRKPKKFLCRLECHNVDRRDGTPLTHVKFFTVADSDIETAHNIAVAAQRQFELDIAHCGEWYDSEKKTWMLGGVTAGTPTVTPKGRKKLSYRWRPYVATGDAAKSEDERRAVAYVEWLAKRDGIQLPGLRGIERRVIWGGIYSEHRTRNARSFSGTKPQHAYLRRIEAVEWGHDRDIYNTRKDGKRGAWLCKAWTPSFRVELPNWNFDPIEPVDGADVASQTDLAGVAYSSRIQLQTDAA